MSLLALDEATIKFGGLTAVNKVSFEVESGMIFGLIGPNGAGKTTCFNLITGLYKTTSGSITFDGHDLAKFATYQIASLGISRTFQNIRLFGDLTVLDNVLLGTYLRKNTNLATALLHTGSAVADTAEKREFAINLLNLLGLGDLKDARSKDLAYGKQRRVEIARAIATNPKLLLLDEPAAGMNPQEKIALSDDVQRIRDEFGKTILVIEHDMKFVMNLCEEIVVLDHGEEIARGKPDDVKSNPRVITAYLGE